MHTPLSVADDDILKALQEAEKTKKPQKDIANELGISCRTLKRRKQKFIKRGLLQIPTQNLVPEGYYLKGVSTLYDAGGEVKAQWVKSNLDQERQQELLEEAVKALKEEIKPVPPTTQINLNTNENLLNCYVITDYHLGMLAWEEETGEDWDIKIAEELIYKWFRQALAQAPSAKTGIFAQLGDFLHWDGLEPVTPTNKHILDADTRFQKLVRVAIRITRRIIKDMLQKYEEVILIQPGGNHDLASSIWLRELFHAFYESEPRLKVDLCADFYTCHEHGKTSLFFHHGHKRKPANIDHVFVSKYREIFGRTKFSYAHMGHLHHVNTNETNLMIIEQHRTLAGRDSYASTGGWLPGRDAKVITYHKEYGEVSRLTISPDMLK